MGAGGEDIILSPKAQQVIPFSFECKNQERLNIWDALKQAEANATETRPGAVVFRKNRSDTYIAFEFQDFVDLLKRAPTPDSRLEGFVSLVRERLEAANQ